MRILFTIVALLMLLAATAQKREEGFDFNFEPTTAAPRYYVITEKKDSGWERQAYYLPERTQAMKGWYKDKEAKVPHGLFTWYHTTKFSKQEGHYINGNKEGIWLTYNEEGMMIDSTVYAGGRPKGVSLGWYGDGMPSDSSHYDGAGNGTRVEWHENGNLKAAGHLVADTSRAGIWKYYHESGKLMATEEYAQAGVIRATTCYDEAGNKLDAKACVLQDADFDGGEAGWIRFLEQNLRPEVPVNKGAPFGMYTVVVQFIVNEDGSVKNVKALTKYGYGMEAEVIRLIKKAPYWIPAHQYGKKVKAYRRQPVTFVVQKG